MGQLQGLTEAEAEARRKRGLGNSVRIRTSRTFSDIIRQNVFTLINVILFTLGTMLVILGYWGDAVTSVGLIILNSAIGIIQELRAKRQLDKIALLTRPKVAIVREGKERIVDPNEIVQGDTLAARAGDQIVADGAVLDGAADVDESLLTGESDLIQKAVGMQVLSGSFVVNGSIYYEAQKVGEDSFANKLTSSARAYRIPRTPLQKDVDLVFRLLLGMALFLGFLMFISGLLEAIPLSRSVRMATVIAGIVPNGLFLMVIVAYALGALRIVSRGALIQQQNSVESLSNVTVLCMDKTGTLTANKIVYNALIPLANGNKADLAALLGQFAASATSTNRTSEAVAEALPGTARKIVDEVPFSSARKWSALAFDEADMRGAFVLGAYEMMADHLTDGEALDSRIQELSASGLRVLVFAHAPDALSLHDSQNQPRLPDKVSPLALVTFTDELRQEAADTIAQFAQAGIRLKVISGDNPRTVAALAKQAGLPGDLKAVSGVELEALSDSELEAVAEETTIFGRITPDQKERLVDALRRRGHYVAMMGDGVNDVLSLKKANLGIAMQSGSAATRGVADMVLLGDSFSALPPAFLEGQRIVSGMRDILALFFTRALFTALLILSLAIIGIGFPFMPKHNSLLTFIAVGIPVFFIAIWARPAPNKGSLLKSIMRFTVTAALTVSVFGLILYVAFFAAGILHLEQNPVPDEEKEVFIDDMNIDISALTDSAYAAEFGTAVARTALLTFGTLTGLLLVIFVEPPVQFFVGGDELSPDKRPTMLALIMMGVYIFMMAIPPVRNFFEVYPLDAPSYAVIIGFVLIWMLVVRLAWRHRWVERFLGVDFSAV